MDLHISASGDLVTVRLSGELDHHGAAAVREEIDRSLEQTRPHRLVLDFRNVSFMDSSGIGLVMGRYRVMRSMDGEVTIVNAPAQIKKVMRLSGLERLARIE